MALFDLIDLKQTQGKSTNDDTITKEKNPEVRHFNSLDSGLNEHLAAKDLDRQLVLSREFRRCWNAVVSQRG